MKIAFVILNYNTYEETRECVLSIEDKIDTRDYRIVIVDNCSTDDSVDRLAELIKGKSRAELIRNPKNMGFARGNNVGIAYVNQKYKPEYVAVCNSDTELVSEHLVFLLDKEYEKSGFALLGPLNTDRFGGCASSPLGVKSVEVCKEILASLKKKDFMIKSGVYGIYDFFNKIKGRVVREFHKGNIPTGGNGFYKYQRQVIVHGCFLIFSKKAFDYIDGFDNRTFMYCEENILCLNLIKLNLVTVYSPEIVIYHKVGCSTRKAKSRKKKRMLFTNKCMIESYETELEILESLQKQN